MGEVMEEPIHLSDEQQRKLERIGKELGGRSVYDLVHSSIDEAILNYERSHGEIK